MATALDAIKSAMRKIKVLDPDEEPTGSEGLNGIELLNDMLAAWEIKGISLGYIPVTATNATLNVPGWALEAIKNNLALRMADEFDTEVPQAVAFNAEDGMRMLTNQSIPINPLDMSHLPGGRNTFNINSGE